MTLCDVRQEVACSDEATENHPLSSAECLSLFQLIVLVLVLSPVFSTSSPDAARSYFHQTSSD